MDVFFLHTNRAQKEKSIIRAGAKSGARNRYKVSKSL